MPQFCQASPCSSRAPAPTPISAVPDAVVHVPGPTIYWPALLPLLILMVGGLLLLTFAAWFYAIAISLLRVRSIILERERGATWIGRGAT